MTRAESLSAQIARCSAELSALAGALGSSDTAAASDEWTPREILLHLVGAVRELPDQIKATIAGAQELPPREQKGGAYIDDGGTSTAAQALDVLLGRLHAVDVCISGLSDDELGLPVRTPVDGVERDVPIGLIVRHMVSDHIDEHILQLRDALSAGEPRR